MRQQEPSGCTVLHLQTNIIVTIKARHVKTSTRVQHAPPPAASEQRETAAAVVEVQRMEAVNIREVQRVQAGITDVVNCASDVLGKQQSPESQSQPQLL